MKKEKPPMEAFKGTIHFSSLHHKAPVQDRFVLAPKPGITPLSELTYFVSYQCFDSFPQLLFKQQSIKTYLAQYSLEIIKHSFHKIAVVV
jgi:hypothetical protein